MLKYRLSTSLLVIALVATALGWYVDHTSNSKYTGTWVGIADNFPESTGYSTSLEIRSNGTFEKIQRFAGTTTIFTGEYNTVDNGLVQFNVTKLVCSKHGHEGKFKLNTNRVFQCRCAIDAVGILIIHRYSASVPFDDPDISIDYGPFSEVYWEAYSRDDAT